MPNNTATRLGTLSRRAADLLAAFHQAEPHTRADTGRLLGAAFADARALHLRGDGDPDWTGRTHAYRMWAGEVYSRANVPASDRASTSSAIRWYIDDEIRSRLTPEELAKYGLRPTSARQRSNQRKHSTVTRASAAHSREVAGGALAAMTAAHGLLTRVRVDELGDLDAREAEAARSTLADIEHRARELAIRVSAGETAEGVTSLEFKAPT